MRGRHRYPVRPRLMGLAALAGGALAAALIAAAAPATAGDAGKGSDAALRERPQKLTEAWMIARGGRLYDNWIEELDATPPTATHPAYPAAGKAKAAASWRCKECHGWDYKGKDGVYGKGKHYTGIEGVRGVAGMAPEKIRGLFMDKTHGFTAKMLPPDAVAQLALFLSRGQIDDDRYIDRATGKVPGGDPGRGAATFQTVCAVCHNLDGKAINFETEANPEYVGTVCRENPWEALHKMRFAPAAEPMVAMETFGVAGLADVLAYCRTLPVR